ncbi:class III lanthipeptide [Glycomyces salinus]|nr:class III lanthipeptide [Glycomyces salinus]
MAKILELQTLDAKADGASPQWSTYSLFNCDNG